MNYYYYKRKFLLLIYEDELQKCFKMIFLIRRVFWVRVFNTNVFKIIHYFY